MTKRIISLLLAVLMFAALPVLQLDTFAAGETITITIGAETIKDICKNNGLDYEFCKAAILKMNGWTDESAFTTLTFGDHLTIPKTNQDAADYLGIALPDSLKPKATGETEIYTVVDHDTLIGICEKKGLDFGKCKAAIMKLNGWSDYNLLTLHTGDKIKLPKTDADAAVIAAAASGSATPGVPGLLPSDGAVAAYMVPYIVKTGETIYGICLANGIDFNRYVNLIMQASGITYASSIHTGDIIFLPSSTATSGSMSIITHVVKGGETTYGICQALGINYGARLNLITALNPNKNLNNIHTGDILYLPSGGTTPGGGGGGTTPGGTTPSGGGAGGYTPASPETPVTQKNVTPKEGAMYYLKEYTVVTDDTIYNLLKPSGFNGEYFNYYVNVMLAANNRATFSNLKSGEKILLATKDSAGAKIIVTGVKVKDGDTVIKMCDDAGISYNDNLNLITKLNPGVNLNSIKTGDIIVLPKKA